MIFWIVFRYVMVNILWIWSHWTMMLVSVLKSSTLNWTKAKALIVPWRPKCLGEILKLWTYLNSSLRGKLVFRGAFPTLMLKWLNGAQSYRLIWLYLELGAYGTKVLIAYGIIWTFKRDWSVLKWYKFGISFRDLLGVSFG